MCGFDGIRRSKYFGEEPNGRAEVEVRLGKLKNREDAGKDEINREMKKGGGDRVVDWIWRLCNMTFENDVVSEDWRSAVIVPVHKCKGERNDCNNYRGLLSVVGKIYEVILVDRVRRVTGGLTDDEQEGFRAGMGSIDQTFTLKQISENAREKKRIVYLGFIGLEKAYDKVNTEALWQVLRMYDVGGRLLS